QLHSIPTRRSSDLAYPTGQFQQHAERCTKRNLVVARAFHIARNGKDLGSTSVGYADFKICLPGVANNPGHRSKRFRVVDGGRLAVQTEAGRERRLEARLPLLALERFQQSRSEEHTSELQSRENLV